MQLYAAVVSYKNHLDPECEKIFNVRNLIKQLQPKCPTLISL